MAETPRMKEYYCRKCSKTVYALRTPDVKSKCPLCDNEELLPVAGEPKKLEQVPCKCSGGDKK